MVSADGAPSRPPPSFPSREDCWSEDATFTLVDAWGERYLELNRGSLRQKHWQEVADTVNDRHAGSKKSRRTDVQCKNRIDTLKKKYKIEKARVSESGGGYRSLWPFFSRLNALIGDTYPARKASPPAAVKPSAPPAWIVSHPVGPRSGTQKRPAAKPSPPVLSREEDSLFRRNFSAFAAAAAAAAEAESGESEEWRSSSGGSGKRGRVENDDKDLQFGYRELAHAIVRFGDMYERVEEMKQRQMVELEKQRMQFAKDLEYQRMQLFMETQVQLQKIKRSKRSSSGTDSFS
ncbi:trihelix transcription factor ENAP2-like isoform X2 [Lotus japonicus]|uniref:trihelix transcription factor ENAP2-like isoform X2 n=1 Tax=Lotus japonicus TaxID=34305 RepID=UPI0025904F45|nr:trihelix transcription factor ENAP2-like isoform X2 [Lotus japonicus]